jgi:hypothetical protein
MIEGWFGFPKEKDKGYSPQQIKLATNKEGKPIYILPQK